ncbi:MAG: oxygen-independent coproporphyrinogen III oxidase-like protein, partial [Burkholderiales bacterium]|nr:oxygen-independent coproporphyrinogen III oxidase-like protein [Burkholderiales bacterium]
HIVEHNVVNIDALPFEFAMNGFRLIDGIPISMFVERTGLPLNAILSKLQEAEEKNYLSITNELIIPNKKGHDFLNDLLMIFLND